MSSLVPDIVHAHAFDVASIWILLGHFNRELEMSILLITRKRGWHIEKKNQFNYYSKFYHESPFLLSLSALFAEEYPHKKKCVLIRTLNYIWWWNSNSTFLGECWVICSLPLFPGPLWLVVPVRPISMNQLNLFEIMFKMTVNFINTLSLKTFIYFILTFFCEVPLCRWLYIK